MADTRTHFEPLIATLPLRLTENQRERGGSSASGTGSTILSLQINSSFAFAGAQFSIPDTQSVGAIAIKLLFWMCNETRRSVRSD